MCCLEADGDSACLHELHHRVGDLLAESLLHGEAPRVETDEPRQLGDPKDLVACDVADVRGPVEGQCMVLAEREKRDRAFDDLAVTALDCGGAFRWERGPQLRIAA